MQSIDMRFSSTNACLPYHCNPCWSDWIRLFARIRDCRLRPISFLHTSGSTTTSSTTSKRERRIALPPSDINFITRGVLRTIDAVHCRSVMWCLRLHYTCFGSARSCVRARINFLDIGLAISLLFVWFLDVLATVPTGRLQQFQRFSGLDCWRGFKMMSRRANRCGDGYESWWSLSALLTYVVSETMPFFVARSPRRLPVL